MSSNFQINPNFTSFKDFLLHIKLDFDKNSSSIHKARNVLKVINYEGQDTIVKSFKVPHLFNRIIYTFFRDSKAKKSYDYSIKIAPFTPIPIGYIEFYTNSLLSESYFVSEKFEYDFTIREPLLDSAFKDRDVIFKAFAKFTYELHEAEILHQDYSPGNILIKRVGNEFLIKVVDINRMEFRPLSLDERLKNFSKLWAVDEEIAVIAKEYAKISGEDEGYCIKTAQNFNTKHKNKINMKKKLKGIPVVD